MNFVAFFLACIRGLDRPGRSTVEHVGLIVKASFELTISVRFLKACFYSRFNVDTRDRDSGGLRTIWGSGLNSINTN